MAKIHFSDEAPQGEAVHFVLAGVEFDLADGAAVYETDSTDAISAAQAHNWLTVDFDPVPEEEITPDYDPEDPHDNPEVDHLGALASPESKEKAAEVEAAIMAEAYPPVVPAEVVAEVQPPVQPDNPQPVAPSFGKQDVAANQTTPAATAADKENTD